jgi:hypothetical protein
MKLSPISNSSMRGPLTSMKCRMMDGPAECRSYSNSTAAPALRCGGRGFFGALTKANESWGESGSRVKRRLSRRSRTLRKRRRGKRGFIGCTLVTASQKLKRAVRPRSPFD